MTAKEYKQEFGYDVKRGLLSDKARSRIRKHTLSNGTINNLKNGKRYWYKSGVSTNYERSEQTTERLKNVYTFAKKDKMAAKKTLNSRFKSVRQYHI